MTDTSSVRPPHSVYALQIRACRLADIFEESHRPSLRVDQLDSGRPLPEELVANWQHLQQVTASAVAAGRAVTTEAVVSEYVAVVVLHHSYWWDELTHDMGRQPGFVKV